MSSSDSPPTALFDRRAWRAHRNRAAADAVDFLHDEIGERLLDRLDLVNRDFSDVLDLGARDGGLARRLATRPGTRRVVLAEPATRFLASARGLRVAADPELVPFREASFDLVVSNLVLHWTADLPGVLVQLRRALRPDGLLLAAMLGGQTLIELRTALFEAELEQEGGVSPRVSPSIELGDAAALLTAGGLCAAGRGQRNDYGRLPRSAGADARPARHGRDKCACRRAAANSCAARPWPAPR